MIEVTIEDLYAEACRKVGELTVTNTLLQAEVIRLQAEALGQEAAVPDA